jgi:hypothetical protein
MLWLALVVASPAFAQQPIPTGEVRDPVHVEQRQEDEIRRFYAAAGMGFDFNRGDYGEVDAVGDSVETDTAQVNAFVRLEWDPFTLRVSVPFVLVDGSETFVPGDDGTPTEDFTPGTRRDYGLGDLVTRLTYTWYPKDDRIPIVDLSTQVKIPTADDSKGLGTGKTDVTLQMELVKAFGPVSTFGGFGYRFKGGPLDDILLASAGLGLRFSRTVSAGIAYDWREASSSGVGDSHELAPYLSIRAGKHMRFGPYGVIGLSEAAPDWGVGSTVAYEF